MTEYERMVRHSEGKWVKPDTSQITNPYRHYGAVTPNLTSQTPSTHQQSKLLKMMLFLTPLTALMTLATLVVLLRSSATTPFTKISN